MSSYPAPVLPQPGLHSPHFHNSVLSGHISNASSSGLLNPRPPLNHPPSNILSPSGSTNNSQTNGGNPLSRPFPMFIPTSAHQSDVPHANSPPASSIPSSYASINSNHSVTRSKRSNTPNSESAGSDCETGGSCRCGIINCVAGNDHISAHNRASSFFSEPSSPSKVEGLTGVYTPTATPAAPPAPSLLMSINNNFNKTKDITVINAPSAPKLFKPYKSDMSETI